MSNEEAIREWGYESDYDRAFGIRESYGFPDLCNRRIINMHLNAGIFNPDHRNDEIKRYLLDHAKKYIAVQHYSLAKIKNKLCETILAVSPAEMKYVHFNSNSAESLDDAVKFAKYATKRERVIYIGTTAAHASDTQVAYNCLSSLTEILKNNDTACVVVESISPAYGYSLPAADYLKSVGELARQYGALYIADEINVGLMRNGDMWCAVSYGAKPDMIVTGKDIAGGFYPLSAVIMNEASSAMYKDEGFDHLILFDSVKLGCAVATKAMEMIGKPATKENVDMLTATFKKGLAEIRISHPYFFRGIRQRGVLMGLQIAHAQGAAALNDALYENGVSTTIASFDPSVVLFRAGLLMDRDLAEETLDILDLSMAQTAERFGFY